MQNAVGRDALHEEGGRSGVKVHLLWNLHARTGVRDRVFGVTARLEDGGDLRTLRRGFDALPERHRAGGLEKPGVRGISAW